MSTLRVAAIGASEVLARLKPRQVLSQALNLALIFATAFMLWKALAAATNSPSPIVVVLSGSMEPAFQRGDLLFLWNRGTAQVGEIVVYTVQGRTIPIVHRTVRRHQGAGVEPQPLLLLLLLLLTKGDNNPLDDTGLYAYDQFYLDRGKEVVGCVVGYVPGLGYASIMLSDHPWLKGVVLGFMALLVVLWPE